MGIAHWIERRKHKREKAERRRSWQQRALPDFIIVGGQKCGTTSLYHYLSQHPKLYGSYKKELHYFSGGLEPDVDEFQRGEAWYRSNFPLVDEVCEGGKVFEATPLYVFHPLAPQRIAELVPKAKLILLLRNPTERAISHYFHAKARGQDTLPIMEAFQAEEQRLAPVMQNQDYKSPAFANHTYKQRGIYLPQIQHLLEYFPREQLLVTESEKLFSDPEGCLGEICEYVGVAPDFGALDLTPRNVGSYVSKVEPAVYAYLDEYFRPHNQQLYEFLGRDLGW